MEGSAYKVVLASSSVRRRKLIKFLGIPVQFVVPKYDEERPFEAENPGSYAVRMAESKVLASSLDQRNGTIIIGSDTVVAIGNMILGKPRDASHAEYMLRLLRNGEHAIHTALSVLWKGQHRLTSTRVLTKINMRNYSDLEMGQYIASGDPMDKAGGYAVQNKQFHLVERLNGCYTSAIGLPLCSLIEMLTNIGLSFPNIQPENYAMLFNECTNCFFLTPASGCNRGELI